MNIWDADKLYYFLFLVLPGFVGLKTYELLYPNQYRKTADRLIDLVVYGGLNLAIMAIPIYFVERSDVRSTCLVCYLLFYVFVLFVSPLIWALVWRAAREWQWVQEFVPHPEHEPWDYVFRQRKSYWVKVRLKDGSEVAGKYADKSFASSSPSEPSIYLEETWSLNSKGEFDAMHDRSAGILVPSSEVLSMEFFHYREESA